MRALIYDRYGPPEQVLRLEQVPQPQPAADEVLVRVAAASLNSWDWDQLAGTPMGRVTGPFRPPHRILGADIAGTVEAVGARVAGFTVGDAVFGDLSDGKWGGLAEKVCAKAAALAIMPQGLSFTDAAALPQAGSLALQALRRRSSLKTGESVLIVGAGGGVGSFAVQLARTMGATVTGVDRASKRDAVLSLGASDFIDFETSDFTARAERYDLIIDMVAQHGPRRYARVLKPGGHLVVVGGTIRHLLQLVSTGWLVGRGQQQTLELLIYRTSPADAVALAQRVLDGTLSAVIDDTYGLEQGGAAFRRLGDGQAIGKVIIVPSAQG